MDEFEECMVRICVELEDLGPDSAVDEGSTAVIDPAALAPKLLAFIEKCVVAHEANQSKKKKKKKPDEDGAKKKGRCAATLGRPPPSARLTRRTGARSARHQSGSEQRDRRSDPTKRRTATRR